jgi:hypothetical protein
VRRIRARISAGFIVRIWQADLPLGERRLVEAQHAPHLPDRVIEIVEHVTVIAGTAYAARRISKLSVQLSEGVARYVDPWIGAVSEPGHRDVSVTGKDTGLLIGHTTMLASQYLDGPLGILICRSGCADCREERGRAIWRRGCGSVPVIDTRWRLVYRSPGTFSRAVAGRSWSCSKRSCEASADVDASELGA